MAYFFHMEINIPLVIQGLLASFFDSNLDVGAEHAY